MKLRNSLLVAAVAVALAACGKTPEATPAATDTTPAPAETTPAPAPAATETPAPAPAADATAAAGATAAPAGDCAVNLEANDAMQFNAKNIDVPASCKDFTINLKHTGKMPATAMGHNVVIAKKDDMQAVATDGMAATPDHVKAGDARVVAHSKVIGGGESTSVTFPVEKVKAGGYMFFCTFPGHLSLMQGTLTIK